jgi:hypothetical protein
MLSGVNITALHAAEIKHDSALVQTISHIRVPAILDCQADFILHGESNGSLDVFDRMATATMAHGEPRQA